MKERTIQYIVQYTDYEGQGDIGPVRTFFHSSLDQAEKQRDALKRNRSGITSIKIIRQEMTISRVVIDD